MTKNTNIGYWERILQAPTPAYQQLFDAEHDYLVREIPKDSKVLDIGCGEGRNIRSILEITPDVSGVDNDASAVNSAKNNFQNVDTVQILLGEAGNLPFEDKTFDVVTFLMILPNLDKDKEKAMREIARVLKDDGFVIMSTFSEDALEERMKVYKLIQIPIKSIEGTRLTFNNGVVSEQFSLEDLNKLADSAKLKISSSGKVGSLVHICKLAKLE